MATVESKATLVAIVIAATGSHVLAQVGFLTWGAIVGGVMAIAASQESVSAPKAAGRVFLGLIAALLVGGLFADVAPKLPWLASYGLAPESLWGLVGLAIGGLWFHGLQWVFNRKLTQ